MQQGYAVRGDEEIDLIELFRQLWKGRLVIMLVTACFAAVATTYALLATPSYTARASISPGSLANFGVLAQGLQARSKEPVAAAIEEGMRLASDSFNVLLLTLESRSLRNEFNASDTAFGAIAFEVKRSRVETDPVTLMATAASPEQAREFLEAYLPFAAQQASAELNNYLAGLGLAQRLEPGALYRLDEPVLSDPKPARPKRMLLIVLGIVLGLMTGMFVVIFRGMAQRLHSANITSSR